MNPEDQKEENETLIALQSIMRIMILVIARLPVKELDKNLTVNIFNVGLGQVFHTISTKNVILAEYSITLLLVILRRMNNGKLLFELVGQYLT